MLNVLFVNTFVRSFIHSFLLCSIYLFYSLSPIQVQDGGRPLIWKLLYKRISLKDDPIAMKFGTLNQALTTIKTICPKFKC